MLTSVSVAFQVLLVGGATRMPAFQRFVKNMTGLEPKGFTVDPDEVGGHSTVSMLLGPWPFSFLFAWRNPACGLPFMEFAD